MGAEDAPRARVALGDIEDRLTFRSDEILAFQCRGQQLGRLVELDAASACSLRLPRLEHPAARIQTAGSTTEIHVQLRGELEVGHGLIVPVGSFERVSQVALKRRLQVPLGPLDDGPPATYDPASQGLAEGPGWLVGTARRRRLPTSMMYG